MREYDEERWLTRYIWSHYSHLMSKHELQAYKVTHYRFKADDCEPGTVMRRKFDERISKILRHARVRKLLQDGDQAFLTATAHRVLRKRRRRINLNRCPSCGRIPRTPKAQQCPWCFASWR